MIAFVSLFLQIILIVLLIIASINIGYLCFFIVPALRRARRKSGIPKSHNIINRFVMLVPAHNESVVLGYLLDSLQKLDYPKEAYKVFVIADNCRDDTAVIAEQKGVVALKRFDNEKIGKPHAIGWALEQLATTKYKYDAVVIFDADNLVSPNFLRLANDCLNSGAEAFQGSVETKNVGDSWVSIGIYITYAATNRIYQKGRYVTGVGAILCGTGMGFSKRILDQLGWDQSSLTEDREFTHKLLLAGVKVAWMDRALVYDEKPIAPKQAVKQQSRWASGMKMDFKKFFPDLLRAWKKTHDIALLDAMYNLIHPFMPGKGLITLVLLIPLGNAYLWLWWACLYLLSVLYHGIGLVMNQAEVKYYGYLLILPFSRLLTVIASIKSFVTRGKVAWDHTKHSRGLSIDDIKK